MLPEPFCVKYVRPLFTVMTVLYSEHWVRKLWQCCHLVFRIHGWAISWRCYLGFYLLKRQHLNWSYLRAFRSHICTIHLFGFPSFLHVVFWCVCVCAFDPQSVPRFPLSQIECSFIQEAKYKWSNNKEEITVCLLSYLINCCLGQIDTLDRYKALALF